MEDPGVGIRRNISFVQWWWWWPVVVFYHAIFHRKNKNKLFSGSTRTSLFWRIRFIGVRPRPHHREDNKRVNF